MMSEKKEGQPEPQAGRAGSVLKRRAFVGSLIAIFGSFNVWVLGKRRGFWGTEMSLIVNGPFIDDTDVVIDSKECDFVEPLTLRLQKQRDDRFRGNVAFLFKGDKNQNKRISVRILLFDQEGSVVGTKSLLCSDGRIAAETPMKLGRQTLHVSPRNSEVFKIDLRNPIQGHISFVKLVFQLV